MKRKFNFTDIKVRDLPDAPPGARIDYWDTGTHRVPNFGVRVSDSGHKTYILYIKWPRGGPARRTIGDADKMSLAVAREKAREWQDMVGRGIDPAVEAKRSRDSTFGSVAEDYIAEHLFNKRRGKDDAREIRNYLVVKWRNIPVGEIERRDIVELVKHLGKRAPYQGHQVLTHVKRIFAWALHEDRYALERNPALDIKPNKLLPAKRHRERVLSDDELRALWEATEQLGYPIGTVVRLLLLTGCRKNEIAAAQWREVDMSNKLMTIPPERFKSDASHMVPLSNDAMAIVGQVPRYRDGDHMFSTTMGVKPINGWSKGKAELDRRMQLALATHLEPFVLHDLRHTVRTRMAALRIPSEVAEMIIGHGRKGIERVYDQHEYVEEMREALEKWAAKLRNIIDNVQVPVGHNVVELRAW